MAISVVLASLQENHLDNERRGIKSYLEKELAAVYCQRYSEASEHFFFFLVVCFSTFCFLFLLLVC